MTKAELLAKLDEQALRDIAQSENYKIPPNFGKRNIVKYLEGMLTLQKIKEYTAEAYEKETKRTIIHETIKEKGIRLSKKETTKIQFDERQVFRELDKQKVDLSVLEAIANYLDEPIPKGKGFQLYDSVSPKTLQYLDRVFVKNESDSQGRCLEFRTAPFLKRINRSIKRVEIRKRFPSVSEIDVTGFDSQNRVLAIAECKDTRPLKSQLAEWIENSRLIFLANKGSLETSYFITTDKLTTGNLDYIRLHKEIDQDSGQLKIVSGLFERIKRNLGDEKSFSETGRVYLSIFQERDGQFTKIFPRK
jgi:hypothetical protein